MQLNIYLESRLDKEGQAGIFFYLSGNGKRSKIFSGIKVSPENWQDGKITRKEANNDLKNSILSAKQSLISRILSEAGMKLLKPDPEEVKREFTYRLSLEGKKESLSQKHSLITYMKDYQGKYANIHKPETLRGINQVVSKVNEFDPGVYMEDLNHDWMSRFCSFLVHSQLQDSTIKSRHIKTIKVMAKDALRLKIPVSDQVFQFSWKAPAKQPFYATWEEVEKIMKLDDFLHPRQEMIRDLFILSCFTGLRFSDMTKISRESLVHQSGQTMLRVVVVKTGFDYQIPISGVVYETLQKYDFKIPVISNQEYNREIKHIAKREVKGFFQKTVSSGSKTKNESIPRDKMYSSHTGRRTFARRMLDKGASLVIVSKILGHTNIETTLGYVGYQPQEVINEFQKVFG